jgi:hypothetical protein
MAQHYCISRLTKQSVFLGSGIAVKFDAVADDEAVVGAFKYLSTRDSGKRAAVSECAWLLEDVRNAKTRFILVLIA